MDDKLLHRIRNLEWTSRAAVVVTELEWTPGELAEAKLKGLVDKDFEPPPPLYKDIETDTTRKPGTWDWKWKSQSTECRIVVLRFLMGSIGSHA